MDWANFGEGCLAIAGVILILYNASNAIFKITTPAVSMKRKIEEHDRRLDAMDTYFKNDLERFKKIDETLEGILQANISMMNHMIDGNNTEKMKQTRDELVKLK